MWPCSRKAVGRKTACGLDLSLGRSCPPICSLHGGSWFSESFPEPLMRFHSLPWRVTARLVLSFSDLCPFLSDSPQKKMEILSVIQLQCLLAPLNFPVPLNLRKTFKIWVDISRSQCVWKLSVVTYISQQERNEEPRTISNSQTQCLPAVLGEVNCKVSDRRVCAAATAPSTGHPRALTYSSCCFDYCVFLYILLSPILLFPPPSENIVKYLICSHPPSILYL